MTPPSGDGRRISGGMGRANVEVVTRLLDAFARRDGEAMVEVLDEDFLFEPAPTPAREYRTYVGHSGMRQYLNDVGETWERLDLTIQEYRHAGDYVLVFGRIYTARQGSVADDPATFVWRLEDGLVVWGKVFRNRDEALETVGISE
ncbi:MAG TPA: nuclear transport factor 2 family protein [Thermoleophilaceae bacterium]|nr:nuclear transport factor 2 family protein [Thermoleophilaceae bacterium]